MADRKADSVPRKSNPLTAAQIKQLKPKHATRPTAYPVGGVPGLHVQITPSGARSWFLRATVAGKRREIGLGGCDDVRLGDALEAAREARTMIRNGIDTIQKRREQKKIWCDQQLFLTTFVTALYEYLPIKQAELSSEKYRKQWVAPVEKYALPIIGSKSVSEVTPADVLKVLQPIWHTKTATARKLRQKLQDIFDYCKAAGYMDGENPAKNEGKLGKQLPAASKILGEEHHPALQQKDIQRFWQALEQRSGMGAEALRFQLLTATRPGAVRFMTWDELDLDSGVWTVQPGRQASKIKKRDTSKRVALSQEAIEIIKRIEPLRGSPYVFWAPRGGALSDATLSALMKKMHAADVKKGNAGFLDIETGEIAVPHGNRSSFKVWTTEVEGYEWQLSEAALWHKLGASQEIAYARSDMLDRRRIMMGAWARFVTGRTPAALPA